MTRSGWHKEPARHSLAARGLRSKPLKVRYAPCKLAAADTKQIVWKSKDFGARLTITSKLVEQGMRFPFDPEDKLWHNQFKITVMNLDNKKKTSFDWYGSYNDYMNGVIKMDEHDILYAVSDWLGNASDVSSQDFEGWADDLGYGSDSRKAELIYKEIEKHSKKIDNLLGPEYGPDVWGMMAQEIRVEIGEG